jgi:hypothetical protein
MANNTSTNGITAKIVKVGSLICLFALAGFIACTFTSCGQKQGGKEASVVKRDLVWKEVSVPAEIKIHSIAADKEVLLTAAPWRGRPMTSYDLSYLVGPGPVTLFLEGQGSRGDNVTLIRYFERQVLSSGEIRTVPWRKFGIRSVARHNGA